MTVLGTISHLMLYRQIENITYKTLAAVPLNTKTRN